MNSTVERTNGSNGGTPGSSIPVQNSKPNQRRAPSPTPSNSSSRSMSSGYSSNGHRSPNSCIYKPAPPSPQPADSGYQITRKVETHKTESITHQINHCRAFVPYAVGSSMNIKITSEDARVRINNPNAVPNLRIPPSPGQFPQTPPIIIPSSSGRRTPETPYFRNAGQHSGYNGSGPIENSSSGDADSRWFSIFKK